MTRLPVADISASGLTIFSLAMTVLGVAAILGAAAVVVRSSALTRSLEILRGTASDLEKDLSHWKARYQEQSETLAKCEADRVVLRDLATSSPEIREMLAAIQRFAAEVKTDYRNLAAMNQRLVVAALGRVGISPDLQVARPPSGDTAAHGPGG